METLSFKFSEEAVGLILSCDDFPGQEINLSELQKEDRQIARLYRDREGKLKIGAGWWLVAEIELPEIKFIQEPSLDEDGKEIIDEYGNTVMTANLIPLKSENVQIEKWALS